jgi:hypothetical protein
MRMSKILELVRSMLSIENTGDAKEESFLKSLCRTVVTEIATEFRIFSTEDRVFPVQLSGQSILYYTRFPKLPIEIFRVRELDGTEVKYEKGFESLVLKKVCTQHVTVLYNFVPFVHDHVDEMDFSESSINQRLLALGMCAEYCLIKGLYDDAMAWDSKYRKALEALQKKRGHMNTKKSFRLKPRVWK